MNLPNCIQIITRYRYEVSHKRIAVVLYAPLVGASLLHLLRTMRIRYIVTAVLVSTSSVLSLFASGPEANKASSWQSCHKKSHLAISFQEKGVLYRQSVLSRQEYDAVHADLQHLQLSDEMASIAHNRIGAVVPSITNQIFKEGGLSRLVQSIMGDDYELSSDIPVEVHFSTNV